MITQHNLNVRLGLFTKVVIILILVGEVIDYRYNDSAEPLVFARGSYAISAQHPEMAKSSASCDAKAVEGDFVGDYLLYLLRETYQRFSADLYPKLKKRV